MMSSSDLGVSLLQMTSTGDPKENTAVVTKALHDMKGLCLFVPENSLFFNTKSGPILLEEAFDRESSVINELQESCRGLGKSLHLGGIPWRKNGRVYNCAVLIRETGVLEETYCKTHLFDLELDAVKVKESESFAPGHQLSVFKIGNWTFATAICYDLRFAELFAFYRAQYNVDAFVVPSAFTAKTGEAHWETLLRARAIESQSYVLAPAQVGEHLSQDGSRSRKTWGQTLAIGPWGGTLAEDNHILERENSKKMTSKPINLVLKRDALGDVRKAMPMGQHRAFTIDLESRCQREEF